MLLPASGERSSPPRSSFPKSTPNTGSRRKSSWSVLIAERELVSASASGFWWTQTTVGTFEPSVGFDIQMVSGFRNVLLGGEGLLQATSPARAHLAPEHADPQSRGGVARYLPGGDTGVNSATGTLGTASALGAAGGILGELFGGADK